MSDYAVLLFPFPPSVNHLFAGKSRRVRAKHYEAWIGEADHMLSKQKPLPMFAGPVELAFKFGRPDERKRDISNLIKAIEDRLVAQQIIEDDSLVYRISMEWASDVVGAQVEIIRENP